MVVARGELVEIGDGFRIPDLLEATGARLREVGTTNRVTRADYAAAIGEDTAFVLKVHPSNFVVRGFTSACDVDELADLGVPVVADIGSGLLAPHPLLPDEPDAATALAQGATLVTASGDKLLGGPQAGLVLGAPGAGAEAVARIRRHPLARAMRVDKLTLAALEATLRGPRPPVRRFLDAEPADLRRRAARLAARARRRSAPRPCDTEARVGGGGAPGRRAAQRGGGPARALRRRAARGRARGARPPRARALPARPARGRARGRRGAGRRRAGMHVLATAGHVDHGKSTLVRALTGMEPDRYAEERRRGMTIDLGFAWTDLPSGPVAFVDVPGHERFVTTMLAGVGPVPAVLLVVAADEGWMPQTGEHVDALVALGVRHGLLVVTRSDLMEPELAVEEARERLADTPLAGIEAVAVSAADRGGHGRAAGRAGRRSSPALPAADDAADVRLWVDRAFTIRGAGTVVTGTLGAGRIKVDDELELATAAGRRRVTVRGLQSLGARRVAGPRGGAGRGQPARRAARRDRPRRRAAQAGRLARRLDPGRPARRAARRRTGAAVDADTLPAELTLHVGSVATPGAGAPAGRRHRPAAAGPPAPAADRRPRGAARPRAPGRRGRASSCSTCDRPSCGGGARRRPGPPRWPR